jgi:hypothetical protein
MTYAIEDLETRLQVYRLGDVDRQTYGDYPSEEIRYYLNSAYAEIQGAYMTQFDTPVAPQSMDADGETPDALPAGFDLDIIVVGAEAIARRARRTSTGNPELAVLARREFESRLATEISRTAGVVV